ncbi:cyclase dehydrase family [Gracilaria domingensis]|nr:cyclase dehydrase family [Gracilaria domingensis]
MSAVHNRTAFASSALYVSQTPCFTHRICRTPNSLHLHGEARRPRAAVYCTASDTPTKARTIVEKQVRVNSDLPLDKTREVLVAIKAENIGGRRRRISGTVQVETPMDRVWKVITAYDKIHLYMPNILSSNTKKRGGSLYLDQTGVISRKLALTSRMLLRVSEDFAQKSITFSRVEGRDFPEFEGRYFLREGRDHVVVEYDLVALPFPFFPMWMVERKTLKEVPKMLAAIREEAILGRHIPIEDK